MFQAKLLAFDEECALANGLNWSTSPDDFKKEFCSDDDGIKEKVKLADKCLEQKSEEKNFDLKSEMKRLKEICLKQ